MRLDALVWILLLGTMENSVQFAPGYKLPPGSNGPAVSRLEIRHAYPLKTHPNGNGNQFSIRSFKAWKIPDRRIHLHVAHIQEQPSAPVLMKALRDATTDIEQGLNTGFGGNGVVCGAAIVFTADRTAAVGVAIVGIAEGGLLRGKSTTPDKVPAKKIPHRI